MSSAGREPPSDGVSPFVILTERQLSDETRRDRRSLLGVSVAAIVIAWMGWFPSQITALGLSFQPRDHEKLMRIVGVVDVYLMLAFASSALNDFASWRHRFRLAAAHLLEQRANAGPNRMLATIRVAMQEVPIRLEANEETYLAYLAAFVETKNIGFLKVMLTIAPSVAVRAVTLDFGLPLVSGTCAAIWLLPWWWIVSSMAAIYTIGIVMAFRISKLKVAPRRRAMAFALWSWFYVVNRR